MISKTLKGINKHFGSFLLTPMLEDSQEAYNVYKSIMTNPDIIKTVSLFNQSIPNEKLMKEDFLLKSVSHKKWGIGFYTITKGDTKEVMGMAGPIVMGENENGLPIEIELGVYLLKKFQCRQLAFQSLFLSVLYTIKKYRSIDKIWGTALAENLASQVIMIKGGLEYKGKKYRDNGAVANYFEIDREGLLFNVAHSNIASESATRKVRKINL